MAEYVFFKWLSTLQKSLILHAQVANHRSFIWSSLIHKCVFYLLFLFGEIHSKILVWTREKKNWPSTGLCQSQSISFHSQELVSICKRKEQNCLVAELYYNSMQLHWFFVFIKKTVCVWTCALMLTWADVHKEPPYTPAVQRVWAKTHRPPEQHFHPDPVSSATCTDK